MKLQLKTSDSNLVFRECILDMLKRIFVYDPRERITADQLLLHPFFTFEDINDITTKDLLNWKPPVRKIPYKEYGHAVSSYPEDMMEDGFGEEIEIQRKLYHCEYYYIFQRLLMKGHVVNVTIDNPFEYGSITPRRYMEAISQEKPIIKSRKGAPTTPRSFVAYCCEIVDRKKRESNGSEKIKNPKVIQIHSNSPSGKMIQNANQIRNKSISPGSGRNSIDVTIQSKPRSKPKKQPPKNVNPIRIDIIQNLNGSSSQSNSSNNSLNGNYDNSISEEDMNVEIDADINIDINCNENEECDCHCCQHYKHNSSDSDDHEEESSDEYLTDDGQEFSSD